MSRILAIDYGKKRTGIAVTDPLCIIANGLATVSTSELFEFLSQYITKESVEREKDIIQQEREMYQDDPDSCLFFKHLQIYIQKLH